MIVNKLKHIRLIGANIIFFLILLIRNNTIEVSFGIIFIILEIGIIQSIDFDKNDKDRSTTAKSRLKTLSILRHQT